MKADGPYSNALTVWIEVRNLLGYLYTILRYLSTTKRFSFLEKQNCLVVLSTTCCFLATILKRTLQACAVDVSFQNCIAEMIFFLSAIKDTTVWNA